jgi:hypothetical protein
VGKSSRKLLRDQFLAWQCQLRQIAMREDGGRPSPGMRPRLLDETGAELVPGLTVLLLPKAPEESTAFFRFQVTKSSDPREIYEKALRYLQADYFQEPKAFSDRLLAVLPNDAPLADDLTAAGRCILVFGPRRKGYRLPCKIKALATDDAGHAAAVWHNRVFNPALPETVHVLAFDPDWASARVAPGHKGRETISS